MPSGSHGGSPGSHRSGGSRKSSGGSSHYSHSSSSSSSSYYSRRTRPFCYSFFGHRYYVPIGTTFYSSISKITTFFIIAVFAMFILVPFFMASNKDIKQINSDYVYYYDIIEYAEQHTEYQTTGLIKGKFQSETCDKWFITYTFGGTDNSSFEGYTYPIYTFEQVKNFHVGDPITLATDSKVLTSETDSIPMSFKTFTVEDDGEYVKATHLKTGMIVGIVIVSVFMGALVAVAIFKFVKSSKRKEEEQQEIDNAENKPTVHRCKYCGSVLKDGETDCKNCGAKLS